MVKKPNTIRVCADIPIEWHEVIKNYNKNHVKQINLSHAFLFVIEKEVSQILIEKQYSEDTNMTVNSREEIEEEMKTHRDKTIAQADAIVGKIKLCTDIKEHTELIDELYFYAGSLAELRRFLGNDVVAKAIEYLDFGFASMEGKIDNCANGQRYDCLGTEEYDLFNGFFQKKEFLKDMMSEA